MKSLDELLAEISERESRATKPRWEGFAGVIRTSHGLHGCNDPDVHKHGTDDSLFIAHARTDIPKLIEVVKHLQVELLRMHDCVFTSVAETTAWMGIPDHKRAKYIAYQMQNADYIRDKALEQARNILSGGGDE